MADLFTYKKLPPDPCLSEEQMTAYIDGKLSAAEQHACEKHMADCAMCEDALEGLSLVKDRSVLAVPLKKTEEPAKEAKVVPLNPPAPNRFRIVYAVAAVLVLVLGSVFILNILSSPDAQSGDLAQNESTADSTIIPPPSVLDAEEDDPGNELALKNEGKNSEETENTKLVPGTGTEGQQGPQPVTIDELASYDQVAEAEQPIPAEAVMEKAKQEDDVAGTDDFTSNEAKENVALEEETDKKQKLWERAGDVQRPKANTESKTSLSKDDAGNGSKKPEDRDANVPAAPQATGGVATGNNTSQDVETISVSDSVAVFSSGVSVAEQNYQAGMNMLNAGQPNTAIIMFDKVLLEPNNPRYEDAEFQKANALIKANRKEEARTLLQSIEAKKGKHAAEATELLKTL